MGENELQNTGLQNGQKGFKGENWNVKKKKLQSDIPIFVLQEKKPKKDMKTKLASPFSVCKVDEDENTDKESWWLHEKWMPSQASGENAICYKLSGKFFWQKASRFSYVHALWPSKSTPGNLPPADTHKSTHTHTVLRAVLLGEWLMEKS